MWGEGGHEIRWGGINTFHLFSFLSWGPHDSMYDADKNFISLICNKIVKTHICYFWVTGIERNVCRCTFNRYSVITQFAKLAAGEQLCRRCTHRKLQHFETFKNFSWKNHTFWVVCKWALWSLSPQLLLQSYCIRVTVPELLCQSYGVRVSVPELVCRNYCVGVTVPELLCQSYCTRVTVPELLCKSFCVQS